jgi:hypothetical protein
VEVTKAVDWWLMCKCELCLVDGDNAKVCLWGGWACIEVWRMIEDRTPMTTANFCLECTSSRGFGRSSSNKVFLTIQIIQIPNYLKRTRRSFVDMFCQS